MIQFKGSKLLFGLEIWCMHWKLCPTSQNKNKILKFFWKRPWNWIFENILEILDIFCHHVNVCHLTKCPYIIRKNSPLRHHWLYSTPREELKLLVNHYEPPAPCISQIFHQILTWTVKIKTLMEEETTRRRWDKSTSKRLGMAVLMWLVLYSSYILRTVLGTWQQIYAVTKVMMMREALLWNLKY